MSGTVDSRPLRIRFVSSYYPPFTVGGAEESTFAAARALVAAGHDVRVSVPRLGDAPPEGGVPVDAVDVGIRMPESGRAVGVKAFQSPRLHQRFARALAAHAADADVVHAQTLDLLPSAYTAARRAHRPVVATIRDLGGVCPVSVCLLHGPRVPDSCGLRKLEVECVPEHRELYGGRSKPRAAVGNAVLFGTARGRSALLRRCDRVVSVGSDLGHVYADAGLLDMARVVHVPNIAELPEPGMGDAEALPVSGPFAMYVGKVSVGKGSGYLLEALELARREEPELTLVVAGRGEAQWPQRLEEAPGVVALGRVPRERIAALYAAARFAVVPSIWPEPFPRAATEALSAGVPVIGTRAGGIPDAIVDGETGLLVEPRDAAALAAAMVALWRDPERGRRLGEAGRADVAARFSRASVVERLVGMYREVVAAA